MYNIISDYPEIDNQIIFKNSNDYLLENPKDYIIRTDNISPLEIETPEYDYLSPVDDNKLNIQLTNDNYNKIAENIESQKIEKHPLNIYNLINSFLEMIKELMQPIPDNIDNKILYYYNILIKDFRLFYVIILLLLIMLVIILIKI